MGLIRTVAILAIDNTFRTPSLELKCLGTSFGGAKQKFSIPRDSTRSILPVFKLVVLRWDIASFNC